jgi:hypothetical protein
MIYYASLGIRYAINKMLSDLQPPVQSLSITTKVVRSNPAHGEMYSIQYYVIKLVSDLRQVGGLFRALQLPHRNKD